MGHVNFLLKIFMFCFNKKFFHLKSKCMDNKIGMSE